MENDIIITGRKSDIYLAKQLGENEKTNYDELCKKCDIIFPKIS